MDKLRSLVNERKALLERAERIAESMRAIPRAQRTQYEFSFVRIAELSAEEQSKIIRFENRSQQCLYT